MRSNSGSLFPASLAPSAPSAPSASARKPSPGRRRLQTLAAALVFTLALTMAGCETGSSGTPPTSGTSGSATGATSGTGAATTSSTTTGPVATTTAGATTGPDVLSQATLQRFRTGEIKEFQGKFLSPAIGPRDNSIGGVQTVDIATYSLKIDGLVDRTETMSYEQVKALPAYERLITLHCVEGWDATILWKGVLIDDLLKKAGVKPEAVTVIFRAVDGYSTSLPLALIRERQMILAYMSNGLPLPPEMGYPFIVVAEDRLGYKWARWVNRIELSADKDYRGYWEMFGYSNDAALDR